MDDACSLVLQGDLGVDKQCDVAMMLMTFPWKTVQSMGEGQCFRHRATIMAQTGASLSADFGQVCPG